MLAGDVTLSARHLRVEAGQLRGDILGNIHLRIEKASGGINNADSLIVSLNLIDHTSLTSYYCDNIESQVLGVKISGEAEM